MLIIKSVDSPIIFIQFPFKSKTYFFLKTFEHFFLIVECVKKVFLFKFTGKLRLTLFEAMKLTDLMEQNLKSSYFVAVSLIKAFF